MSEASRDLVAPAERNKVGPDHFNFSAREVAELLSQDEDFLPFVVQTTEFGGIHGEAKDRDVTKHCNNSEVTNGMTGSGALFSNGVGSGLSDFRRERLKALLRQSVCALTQEVDEIMDPVLAMHKIRSQLRYKKHKSSRSGSVFDVDAGGFPQKKLRMSSSTGIPVHASPVDFETNREEREPLLDSSMATEKENGEIRVNDDLKFLLENDSSQVEGTMKKYSDELSATLKHMEQQLEELLDTVMSRCRPMTLTEKQQLRNLIQNLPPRNLDRVVEIIQHSKPAETHSCEEIHVDLEKEDDATLWRLYYYIKAVESAGKHSL
ncbi:uncharacterized protein LOC131168654 isoform X1 [Malania oleifera]|uniref:uncharacterized protein LOC131168654 isoform X1 n=1 Tax=Malania oleifera TaxID=397392 RepID=UPI0025AE1DD1|nr:uncharacterized protein LOC131168654 isoform X1 [Malania oleifera]XP_057984241.1 uncharacterized protein LOC131168654 isoform X1 [Malania oleifera]